METNPDGSITADQLLEVIASLKEGDNIPLYVHFTGRHAKYAIRRLLIKGQSRCEYNDVWWSTVNGKGKHMSYATLCEPDTAIFLNFFYAYAHALRNGFPLPHDEER